MDFVGVVFSSWSESVASLLEVERFVRAGLEEWRSVEETAREVLLRVLRGVAVQESARFRFIVRRARRDSADRRFSMTATTDRVRSAEVQAPSHDMLD